MSQSTPPIDTAYSAASATPAKAITMRFDVHELLAKLAQRRPIFHAEADFQHEFAWEIHRQFPDASIRLEKPVSTSDGVVHLDVLIRHGGATIAIELKYKTKRLSLELSDETYNLRNHSAQDLGRYDFIKDISRLEAIASLNRDALGYAILLTNESAYWRKPPLATTVDAAFRLYEGKVLAGKLAWGEGASAGTMKSRENPIHLRNSYTLGWKDYSSPPRCNCVQFRYLLVPVPSVSV